MFNVQEYERVFDWIKFTQDMLCTFIGALCKVLN